jgi:hypothetical protein
MMKMMFAANLVYNKVVDNLLILLFSNFHGNRPNGLRVIHVSSWSSEMLVLWNSKQISKITLFDLVNC